MFYDNFLIVFNSESQIFGLAVALEDSPYWHEQTLGQKRLKVWVKLPGAGDAFYGWDWWALKDVTPVLSAAPLANTLAAIA